MTLEEASHEQESRDSFASIASGSLGANSCRMLKDQRVQLALGIGLGLIVATEIAGFLGWISWSAAVFSIPIVIVFFFAIPSKLLRKSVYTLSVGFWIAVGTVLVPLVARLFNLGQYLGWFALDLGWLAQVWLIASVVAGILRPLPSAKKLVGEN